MKADRPRLSACHATGKPLPAYVRVRVSVRVIALTARATGGNGVGE
ncbi:hypothetical protein [Novosphingobium aromaticivorans]|nr:hypothetical protein [Novosphingobium aromaticivorans]